MSVNWIDGNLLGFRKLRRKSPLIKVSCDVLIFMAFCTLGFIFCYCTTFRTFCVEVNGTSDKFGPKGQEKIKGSEEGCRNHKTRSSKKLCDF